MKCCAPTIVLIYKGILRLQEDNSLPHILNNVQIETNGVEPRRSKF